MVLYQTERLAVRPYVLDDVGFVLDMYSRWEVWQYLGPAPKPLQTVDEAIAAIERWRALSDGNPLLGLWAVTLRRSGDRVGSVLMKMAPLSSEMHPLPLSEDVEIGWHVHPPHWGKGYAVEAAAGALKRTFASGVREVIAVVHPENERSKRVAAKLGMVHAGLSERYYSMPLELYRATARG